MSAEVLRRAASLMRERAEAATPDICPEWTRSAVHHVARNCEIECWHEDGDPLIHSVAHDDDASWNTWDRYKDASHIASWHPVVALAVADHLDLVARLLDQGFDENAETRSSLAVARAYLGESS